MPHAFRILLTHAVSTAIMLGIIVASGQSPRVFVYGLFFNYLYRLLTLQGLLHLHGSGSVLGRKVARALTRPPHASRPPAPVMVHSDAGVNPGGLGAYLGVLAVCAFFTFVMINDLKDEKITVPASVIVDEVLSGFLSGVLWWVLDLVDRRIAVRFGEPLWANFGYNSTEATLLAVTLLTGGVVTAVVGSAWPYFIALLLFKTWFDVWDESKFPRGEHPPGG